MSDSAEAPMTNTRRGITALSLSFMIGITGCGSEAHDRSSDDDATAARSAQPLTAPSPSLPPQRVIVKLRDDAPSLSPARTARRSLGALHTRHLEELSHGAMLWAVEPNDGAAATEEQTRAAVEALRRLPEVEYAHADVPMYFFATPNDPDYPLQWHYRAINLPAAWSVVTGGVPIAVIDTGEAPHPDLAGKWLAGYNFGSTTPNADPTDDWFWHHGLHVAGILAADTNNGLGGAGICPGCSIIPVKIDDQYGTFYMANVGLAIDWAVDHGARVINMSFGTVDDASPCAKYQYLQTAVNYAASHNVVVVAAAGNSTADVANVSPASCSGVIAVAASDPNNQLAPYSNFGTRIDVTAPGGGGLGDSMYGNAIGCPPDGPDYSGTVGVVSSWAIQKPGRTLLPGDYCYRYLSGTSMASPHVAGVAALILSQYPTLTPAYVLSRLKEMAHPIAGCGTRCGAGLIDAGASVFQAKDNPCKAADDMCVTGTAATCHTKGGVVVSLPCAGAGQTCCAL
jgi:subtilisin family serine protease